MADHTDLLPSSGFLLWHVSLRWRVAMDRALAPLGLTHAQYVVVASLHDMARHGVRPSQRQLADHSGLEPMYVSRLARVLENNGLLSRGNNPADPRAVELALTAKGTSTVEAALAVVRELEERYLAPLGGASGADNRALRTMLQALLEHADTRRGTTGTLARAVR